MNPRAGLHRFRERLNRVRGLPPFLEENSTEEEPSPGIPPASASRHPPAGRSPQFGRRAPTAPAPPGGEERWSGVVSANRAGFGFVKVRGMDASVFLPPREMSKLMHGDRVRVTAEQGADQRWSGRVDKVLERGIEAFLGTVENPRSQCLGALGRPAAAPCIATSRPTSSAERATATG